MAKPTKAMQLDIFGGNYECWVPAGDLPMFRKVLTDGDWGGNQRLAYKLQLREHLGHFSATDEELNDCFVKAWAYGDGTWQKYFRVIEQAGRRAGWKPTEKLSDEVQARREAVLARRVTE